MNPAAVDDPGRLHLDLAGRGRGERTETVQRHTQGVHDSPHHGITDGNLRDAARPSNLVPFPNLRVVPHDGDTDVVFFKVQDEPHDPVPEFHEFARHRLFESINTRYSVTDGEDRPRFRNLHLLAVVLDLLPKDRTDFFRSDIHNSWGEIPLSPQAPHLASNFLDRSIRKGTFLLSLFMFSTSLL